MLPHKRKHKHTHTHKHCLLSRAWKDESTLVFLHDSHLSAKTNSDFSYNSRAYQCCPNLELYRKSEIIFCSILALEKHFWSFFDANVTRRNLCVLACVHTYMNAEWWMTNTECRTNGECWMMNDEWWMLHLVQRIGTLLRWSGRTWLVPENSKTSAFLYTCQ